MNLTPTGMTPNGQFVIAQPGDIIINTTQPDWNAVSGLGQILNQPVLATVATSGSYNDLLNKPSIPAGQVNSDWNSGSGVSQILNKPAIPSATSQLTNDSGFITSSSLSPYATSSALTSGLATKQGTITLGTTAQYFRGDFSLAAFPSIPAAQVNSDWNAVSGVAQILNKPTNVSAFTNDAGYITSSALSPYVTSSSLSSTLSSYATTVSLSGYVPTSLTVNGKALTGNITLAASDVGAPSGSGSSTGTNTGDQTITLTGDVTGSGTGSFAATIGANKVTYAKIQQESAATLLGNPTGSSASPSEITLGNGLVFSGTTVSALRTTSTLSLSLVGTGATGTQISATKDSTVRCCVSTSTTSTIGGPSTSVVALKICATNNATEGSWTTVATFESDQTITLALALQSIQIVKGQLCSDVPAAWYVKLVNSGTGTHAESYISGQQTVYG